MPKTVTKAELLARIEAQVATIDRYHDDIAACGETIRILRARVAALESREDRAWPGEGKAANGGDAVRPQSLAAWHPWR